LGKIEHGLKGCGRVPKVPQTFGTVTRPVTGTGHRQEMLHWSLAQARVIEDRERAVPVPPRFEKKRR
jgi:hypothetical protein